MAIIIWLVYDRVVNIAGYNLLSKGFVVKIEDFDQNRIKVFLLFFNQIHARSEK